jgi:two-component system aerobic respiration control sensor histidine kinase ArcB
MKLLVVDDNKDITDVVRFYCESKDLDCTVINTGIDGLDRIHNNNEFDLILLDLAMPEVSGLDVIKSLKDENLLEQKNIVVFTASSDPKIMEEIRNSGVKGVLKKPCSVDVLTALVEKFRTND